MLPVKCGFSDPLDGVRRVEALCNYLIKVVRVERAGGQVGVTTGEWASTDTFSPERPTVTSYDIIL